MKVTIHPSSISGPVTANASKSSMQRACAAALLNPGITHLANPGRSNDDKAAIGIIRSLGASVEDKGEYLEIKGVEDLRSIELHNQTIDCGESGLSIRMFTPIAAMNQNPVRITGSGSLVSRPMDFFDSILPLLEVDIQSNQGKLPLVIQGPLVPKNIRIDGSLSSQFLTGLLMAYSASGAENVSISVDDLKSRPYIDLTLAVMKQYGMRLPDNEDYKRFVFSDQKPKEQPAVINYFVEGDWSGGAFLLVAGAIAGPVLVRGLSLDSTQADKAVFQVLQMANAQMVTDGKGIRVSPSTLHSFTFDATDCPDLFPPLVALAAYADGESRIKGVHRLTHKESNRAQALKEEFGKMGVQIRYDEEWMSVHGGGKICGAEVHSHHDHRIAMACAIAALKADGPTVIEAADAINKSYPDFYRHLQSLGVNMDGVKPFQFSL